MSKIPAFPQRLSTALSDSSIAEGLADFQERWQGNRNRHVSTLEARSGSSFAELAHQIATAKQRAREHPEILQRFCQNAQSRGAQVLRAATAEEACQAIAQICRDHQARLVVKTKSMATEEIFLNEHLESAGISAVETDLGEWLLQCAQDRPSHLIVPAIHKRRHDIAKLLEQIYAKAFNPDDIQTMARVVRTELRPHFMAAGVGITGANILIADTGSVVLVTNEGNAGLTLAVPPVHIVLAGWDKLVETTADALKIVQLLAKSATGQVISSYTQFIHGPIRGDFDGTTGAAADSSGSAGNTPKNPAALNHPGTNTQQKLYIVLLDNGRSDIAANPEFESVLSCIRCGACSNVCPPYQVVGGHAFGHVYTGAIGLVTAGFHHGWEAATGPQSLCVSCGACAKVCPAEIPLPQQILAVRAKVYANDPKKAKRSLRLGMRILRSRRLTAVTISAAGILTAPLRSQGTLKRLPLPKKFRWRTPPAIPSRPARRLKELKAVAEPPARKPNARKPAPQKTALFLQCISDRLVPSIPLASLQLLQACGADVVIPTSQHCCGLPAIDMGDLKSARQMAGSTLDVLEGYDRVVTPATSCAIAIKHDYKQLFADNPRQLSRAEALAEQTVDLVTYLNEKLPTTDDLTSSLRRDSESADQITVHPFCQNNTDTSLSQLLEKVCGAKPIPLPEGDVCCGFGGSVSLSNPEVSEAILNRKLKNAAKTQARVLVTDNPGCVLHIRGGAQAQKAPFQVLHIAEFLEQYLRDR